ncbi:MAG TPA: DNA mismatch repair endonuclease MutL, partial [Terriglobales bacterium]|nr:DNA mismatch repair endonuclease MutL [Terriglobales bacterium]
MTIQILSEQIASRIAAGEVVERPASVVKELVENSLDAGATEISIWVEKSGTARIRVTDNGDGMSPEDLSLSVERHSTSKITDEGDLFRIETLGFRGEALPSIGSVSKMEIVSRSPQGDSAYSLRVEGGKRGDLVPVAAAVGTTIDIEDIFYNTPARRKFLKSPATELAHVCAVVNRLALAYPRVHFRLAHDGRSMADYVSVNDSKDRLHQVLGREIASQLVPFSTSEGAYRLSGHLSVAPVSFANARQLFTFVNRRYVHDKVLIHAVVQAYATLLMRGQYPAVVLFFDLPLEEVDVNVHPAKFEVRFRYPSAVHESVGRAVRLALKKEAREPSRGGQPLPARSVVGSIRESSLPYGGETTEGGRRLALGPAPAGPRGAEAGAEGFFSTMTILGQVLGCYLVCACARGLALIDQHAAHERVTFEKLRRQLETGKIQKQSLLIPQTLQLATGEGPVLEERLAALESFGFVVEPFGPQDYAVTAIPALLAEGDYRELVQQMMADLPQAQPGELQRHL